MTSKVSEWELSETSFADQEDAITDFRGGVISSETMERGRRIINSLSTGEDYAVDFKYDEILFNVLNAKVNMARVGASKGRHGVTSESLSHKLLVSPDAVRRTV